MWDEIAYPFPNFNITISSHSFLGMWLLIYVKIKIKPGE